MNETDREKMDTLEHRLERLVDGELSAGEYRALLNSLDDEPDGWRRCALIFLQSQALAKDFGSLRHLLDALQETPTSDSSQQLVTVATGARAGHQFRSRGLHLLAIAASFIAALAIGIVTPRFFSPPGQEPPLVGNFQQPGERHEVLRPAGDVRLVMDGDDGQPIEAGHVPVYEATGNLEELLTMEPAAMGPELIELFQRHGFEIQHQPQFVPAPLEDGRHLIVPVDGYQITPVGRRY